MQQAVQSFEETYKNLKFFLNVVTSRKEELLNKVQEFKSTLNYVQLLEDNTNGSVQTKFEIADGLYLPCKIDHPKTVNLWIGVCYFMIQKM